MRYSHSKCHFCGKDNAFYQRAEDAKPHGPYFDACYACAKKPYSPDMPPRLKGKQNENS